MIESRRINLRPLTEKDLKKSRQWVNNWEICQGLLRYLPVADWEHKEWFKKLKSDRSRITFAIEVKSPKKYIGNIGLRNINWRDRNGDLFIYIGEKNVWGKGYGAEATQIFTDYCFRALNLHKVYLRVAEYNKRAVQTYKKAGFKIEGKLEEDVFMEGRYHNVIRMAALNKL